ncbi:ACT domain-containing protein, partial [Micromonospora sp. NPDC002411]
MTLWRIRATVDDRPGYLSVLTASLALRGVNILTVQVQPTEQGAVDDFLVDAPDTLDEAELVAAVERGRGRDCWVARSEARGLADQPTRVLGLANRLVRDPDATGEALRALLGADSVSRSEVRRVGKECMR